jgi:hypothetical protein
MGEENGWLEYKKLILAELTRSNERLSKIENELSSIKEEIAILKTKMYFGSAIVAVIISIGVTFISNVIKG